MKQEAQTIAGMDVEIADPDFLKLTYHGHKIFIQIGSRGIIVGLYRKDNDDRPDASCFMLFEEDK